MRIRLVHRSISTLVPLGCILVLLLNGCTLTLLNVPGLNSSTSTPGQSSGPTATPLPAAAVTFRVALPSPLLAGETLSLSVVD